MSPGIFLIAIPAALTALLLPLAGQAAAAVPLPAAESPDTTFEGHSCDYADIEQGYGMLNGRGSTGSSSGAAPAAGECVVSSP